jgi:hypothetical protein
MSTITQVSTSQGTQSQQTAPFLRLQLSNKLLETEEVVQDLASRNGPLDVYCWYEGPQGLPRTGAVFWRESIFGPLVSQKKDVTMCLYSLKGWDFAKSVSKLSDSKLGQAINRIGSVSYRCIFASSFFRYCANMKKESSLYQFIKRELPQKQRLIELSLDRTPSRLSVTELFEQSSTLFDLLPDQNANKAYSCMQYVEGYYLIQESVRRALAEKKNRVQIAFVMPNDEGKYYGDLPQDLARMLNLDFGDALNGMQIDVSFLCFRYKDLPKDRPYIDKTKKEPKIAPTKVGDYLPRANFLSSEGKSEADRGDT